MYSMGCNTDTAIEAGKTLHGMRKNGKKVAIIGELNSNLPFMYGDAVQEANSYDIILKGEQFNYPLFEAPKDPVALPDHLIVLNMSTLLKDGGTIQVGIGAPGDAIVAGLEMRNEYNDTYNEVLRKAGIKDGSTSYPCDMNNKANMTKIKKILGEEHLKRKIIPGAFFVGPKVAQRHIERMELANPAGIKEKIMHKIVIFALRNNKRLN